MNDIFPSLAVPLLNYLAITALVIGAVFFDLRTRRIPNLLVVAGACVGVFLGACQQGIAGISISLLGLATGFALFLPGYALRMTGGGDLKLLAALGTLLGPRLTLYAFALYLPAALAWALLYSATAALRRGMASPFSRYWAMLKTLAITGRFAYQRPAANELMGQRLPMAPAIAFGVLTAPLFFST